MGKFIDMSGMICGRLTVTSEYIRKPSTTLWKCACRCGKVVYVAGWGLRSGRTQSCGCLANEKTIERFTTHGQKHTRLYDIWCNMKGRCYTSSSSFFDRYGGRGIIVCPEWRKSFEAFRDWALANGYAEGLTIDRKDNDGNYEPSNCRWATQQEQSFNTSRTVYLTYKGIRQSLKQWAIYANLPYDTLYYRINHGWSVKEAIEGK